jgi:hypothetical protein
MDLEEWLEYLEPVWLTMFVFGTLTWLYVIAIQITHPGWLPAALTHYKVPPFDWHVDDVGILSFAIAAFAFFVWRVETGTKRHQT